MANLSNINGKFVVEQTTGFVGIGTTDPAYLLHVNSSDVTNGTRIIIENTNGSGKKYGLLSDNTGVFTVRDITAGADRFSISNLGNATFAGNIRTGTSTLTANTNFDNLVIEGSANTGITIFSGTSSDGGIYFGDSGANNLGQIKYLHSTNAMTFATNDGSPSLTLDSDQDATFAGNIGTPSITATSFIEIRNDAAALYFENAANNNYYRFIRSSNDLYLDYYNGSSTNTYTIVSSAGDFWSKGFFAGTGTGYRRTYLQEGGFRCTSSADQASTLDIAVDNQKTQIYSNYYSGGSNNDICISTYPPSQNQLYLNTTGNVGIGTASPGYKLSVANASTRIVSINYQDSLNTIMSHAGSPNYGLEALTIRGDYIAFYTDYDTSHYQGLERMRITSAGGISFGSTGTAYGTSGQVLTSNGNAAPTWQAAGGGTVTWPNVGAGIRTNYTLGIKPPANGYAGFYFQTSTGTTEDAGYLLIRGTSDAGQVYKAEGITLVADAGWLSLVSRTTSTTGVRILSGSTSAERLVIQDNGHSHFVGNLGIGTSSTSFSSDYDNLIVGTGVGNNGIGIYSGTTGNSTLAFIPDTGGVSDFQIRVEHDYPFGNMEVYFQHSSDSYLRMFERSSGQDPIIKVGNNSIPLGLNTGDDAIMQFRPENSNWFPAIAINAEDSGGNSRGFIEMKSNRSQTSSADYFLKFFNYNSNEIGSIRVNNNNNNVAFNTSSDYRMKEDLKEFKALDTVSKIKVYNYKWKDDSSGFRDQGILAHELDELIPQAVSGEKDATDKDNNILPQSVDYSKIVPHLVQSIQELKAEIEILKNK